MNRICKRSLGLERVNIGDITIRILHCVDDLVFLTCSRQVLQSMLDRFEFECIVAEMKLNVSKTHVMIFSGILHCELCMSVESR